MNHQNNPLHTDLCGVSMDSPIVLLSGCVGFGEEYTRVEGFSNRDVGGVVLKGTTGDARLGKLIPRLVPKQCAPCAPSLALELELRTQLTRPPHAAAQRVRGGLLA